MAPARRVVAARDLCRPSGHVSRAHVAEILTALGMDLDTPGTAETPQRFLRALYDATAGYDGDPKLLTAFPAEHRRESAHRPGQIVEGPIAFFALCEHHALPFHGVAHVAYVADQEIIGISKLTRLVRVYARRFTVQERLGEQIADTLVDLIDPQWRRRSSRGGTSLHADARCQRGVLAHRHLVLARPATRTTPTCAASSSTRCARVDEAARAPRGAGRPAVVRSAGRAAGALPGNAGLPRASGCSRTSSPRSTEWSRCPAFPGRTG